MFNRPATSFGSSGGGGRGSSGGGKREQTKAELLAQLSQQREERALQRARNAAATTIAAAFRGRHARLEHERALDRVGGAVRRVDAVDAQQHDIVAAVLL